MSDHQLINLEVNEEQRAKVAKIMKEKGIRIPTLKEMKDPTLIPDDIKEGLKKIGNWDINPLNLYRISWYNEPKLEGGLFNDLPTFIEIPSEVSGVPAKIVAMSGKYFPTGCHKVGASYACLVPRLVTGQFDPEYHSAVWPSTGNYCRGGAFNSKLLGCKSIAILPENMSAERFNWLKEVADETIATYGSESNVKEIYDETWRLRRERPDAVIFNQFAELGNHLWHYNITAGAMESIIEDYIAKDPNVNFAGVCVTSGSGGSTATGDYLKKKYPLSKLAVGEALQCPTLLYNGYGDHRIEGIGDKHIPWVHNCKNTDMVMAIDDNDAVELFQLFNEKAGNDYFKSLGVAQETIDKMNLIGISGAANILMCVKFAKWFELTENDLLITVLTDSADMYQSRLAEYEENRGHAYTEEDAKIRHRQILTIRTDHMEELDYYGKKRIHNLKYYTWVEQQGMDVAELNAQWYDYDNYWEKVHEMADDFDAAIEEFNKLIDEM